MSGNGPSAPDIITYIGVPLAVLGVLPILYNTVATLVALSRIKRTLRHSKLTALTRSDVVNRVIEVELPRYAATPWDRFQDRKEYWTLSRHPSNIPGGTWTTFNWRTNAIGIKTQRLEYADQLRQPQAEVAFDELVSYLLDLGAVPDKHGWRLLRSTGLWTPVGCALMKSPDGRENALTVAPLDDSDGNLSLAVSWSSHWTTRNYSSLPPYWVRLPPPPPPVVPAAKTAQAEGSANASGSSPSSPVVDSPTEKGGEPGETKRSLDSSIQQQVEANAQRPITCQISTDGIVTALTQEEALHSSLHLDSLYIEHVRVRPGKTEGMWFASAVTAYGTTSQTILWNYAIPADVLAFARRDTVPCGVLVLLGVVDEGDTPQWATTGSESRERSIALDRHMQQMREQQASIKEEMQMDPMKRQQAVQARIRRETEMRMQEMRDRRHADEERRERRLLEAMQSPKWDTKLVADHNLRWLRARKHVAESLDIKEVVGTLLHRMVLEGEFTAALCKMLDLWRVWADNGGMRQTDMRAIEDDQVTFALATLVLAVIKDTSTALEGTLSLDLQECLRMWKKVRLG